MNQEPGAVVIDIPMRCDAEEWTGILRQIRQAEHPRAANSLAPSQVKKLVASDGATKDMFGRSVAIGGDIDTIVVGAWRAACRTLTQGDVGHVLLLCHVRRD
jgi:hypothetical protein